MLHKEDSFRHQCHMETALVLLTDPTFERRQVYIIACVSLCYYCQKSNLMTLSTTARIVHMVPCFINYKAFPCFFLLYTAAIRIKPLLQPSVVIDRTFNLSLQQCLQSL